MNAAKNKMPKSKVYRLRSLEYNLVMEEKLSKEDVERVYEVIFNRVKRVFPEKSGVKFVSVGEYCLDSIILGIEVKGDGFFPRRYNISARREKDGEFRFVLAGRQVMKRNVVKGILNIVSKGFDIFLCGETVMLAEETLESLLIEADLRS